MNSEEIIMALRANQIDVPRALDLLQQFYQTTGGGGTAPDGAYQKALQVLNMFGYPNAGARPPASPGQIARAGPVPTLPPPSTDYPGATVPYMGMELPAGSEVYQPPAPTATKSPRRIPRASSGTSSA